MSKDHLTNPSNELSVAIKKVVQSIFSLSAKELSDNYFILDNPPPHIEADYSFSTFDISKLVEKDSSEVAISIAEHLSSNQLNVVEKVFAVGPHVNIRVNEVFYQEAVIKYILHQGKDIGVYCGKESQTVLINYLRVESVGGSNLVGSRVELVGEAIGRCYKLTGNNVSFYKEKNINPDRLALTGRKITNNALKLGAATYLSNTNAVITLPSGGVPAMIIQKNDSSISSFTKDLIFMEKSLLAIKPTVLIFLYSKEWESVTESLIDFAKKLGCLSDTQKISTVAVGKVISKKVDTTDGRSLRYDLLRVSADKDSLLDQDYSTYFYIVGLINKLRSVEVSGDHTTNLGVMKLLDYFPVIISEVKNYHEPHRLCVYLEKLAKQSEEGSVFNNKELANAVAIVLQNGLDILVV